MSEDAVPARDAGELVATAAAVVAEVQALRGDLASRRSLRRTWGVIAVDVVLSVVGFGLWWGQHQANDRINQLLRQDYTTASQQQQTRQQVLCPLYELLLSSEDPAARAALPPAKQALYDREIRVITDGYAALRCTSAVVAAPPTSSATR